MARIEAFLSDRLQLNGLMIVLCFVAVMMLSSQSAASYPSYVLAVLMLVSMSRWSDVFQVPQLWPILAVLIFLVASGMWSDPFEWRRMLSVGVRAVLVFLFVVALAEVQLRGQVFGWLNRSLAVTAALAALAALAYFVLEPRAYDRLAGLGQLENSVVAGLVFGVSMVFIADLLVSDPSAGWRRFAPLAALPVLAAVLLSGSRNALGSVAVGLIVFACSHMIRDRHRFIALTVTLTVLAAVSITALVMNEGTRELLLPRGASFRPEIWHEVVSRMVGIQHLVGAGILTPDGAAVAGEQFHHPHSMYVSVYFQGGWIALTLFAAVVASSLAVLLRYYDQPEAKRGLAILVIALLSYVLDGHELIDKVGETWFLFWFPVAISLGLRWQDPAVSS